MRSIYQQEKLSERKSITCEYAAVEEGGPLCPAASAVLSKNIPVLRETFLQHLVDGTFATSLLLSACK